MDAFEIGIALAAPGEMQAGLAVMVEMLTALDDAAAAGWIDSLNAGPGGVRPGGGAAPDTVPAVTAQEGDAGSEWLKDAGAGSAVAMDHSAAATQGDRQPQGDRSSGGKESQSGSHNDSPSWRHERSGLKPRKGVHLKFGHGLGGRGAMNAPSQPAVKGGVRRGGSGVRSALKAAEVLREVLGASAAPAAGAEQLFEANGESAAGVFGGLDAPPAGAAAGAASAGLVSEVAAVRRVVPGGLVPPGKVGERSRSAAAFGGVGETRGTAHASAPLGPLEDDELKERSERSAAEPGAARGGGGLLSSRAAAPDQEEGGSSAGGMASLELDGRVIGQWLGERMARDASRPGAGTTFFDPRQAPAWSPSGSL